MKKLFLFAALAFSLNGFAQKVSGKIGFQKGQKLEVVTESKRNSSQELMGQTMESTMNSTTTEIFDVQDATAASATIEHKTKRFQFSAEGMGQSQTFDSEKPDDLKGEMGQVIDKKVLKNKYTMTIDAFGKVTAVKADDDNPNGSKKDEEAGMAEMLAQQLGGNFALPKAGDPTMFSILPGNREVSTGDSWSDSTAAEGTRTKRNFVVKSITADQVVLDFTAETKIEKTIELMGNEASVHTSDKSSGSIIIDRKTGLVRSMTTTGKTEGTVDVQGMSVPVTADTTTTVTVKTT
ncbi:DUF6263 family protein [Flaviaesturariibacter terrae]